MSYKEEEIIDLLKKHSESTEKWVTNARDNRRTLNALVTGENFSDVLIKQIEHLESTQRATVRKKYSKDIRDLFSRVMKKRQNVFDANGGSTQNLIDNENIQNLLKQRLDNFKSNKSLFEYLSESYFQLSDVDPNGLIMMEYKVEGDKSDLYPTYKSIDDIRYYEDNGQLLNYLVFEPVIFDEDDSKLWRFVDSESDFTYKQIGSNFVKVASLSFINPFGAVPAVILSEINKIGSKERVSNINDITELSKDYARDKSVLTIYKFQKGHPLHWRYSSRCKSCSGTGKTGNNECSTCDGRGYPRKTDVSDIHLLPIPEDGQPFLQDKVAGFTSPDLETWKQYKEDLRDMENLIEDTIWGTDKTHQEKNNNETATGRYIDVQPITNTLNKYTDVIEYVYNTLVNWTINFVDQSKDKDKIVFKRSFGRSYIIESPNIILDKYNEARKSGSNNTILDKLLQEYILSKYKSDTYMQGIMLKKAVIEPYVHQSIKEVFEFYGAKESNKKVLFNKFWTQADKNKDEETLSREFDVYFNTNNTIEDEQRTSANEGMPTS